MAFRLILSDLGGVVVDFDADRLVHQVAMLIGQPFDDVQAAVYHKERLLPLEVGRISPQAYYAGLQAALQLPWTYDQFVRVWNDIFSENRSVVELLQRLARSYRVVALTNTNVPHLAHLKASLPSLAFFSDWVASCDVGLRKPDPAIYRLALARAGAKAEETVYIDDRPEMVEAGRAIGLTAIRCESGAQLERDLRTAGVVFK